MKKLLVGISSLLIATGMSVAGDCVNSSGNKCGCKPKKYRIVYVTAHNPDTLYGEGQMGDSEIGADYRADPYIEVEPTSTEETPSTERKKNTGRKNWYVGGRLGADFLTWKNKYKATPSTAIADPGSNHDDYVFEPVFGGGIFAGLHFNPHVRGEIEGGYMTQFSDSDNGVTFKLSTPYVTANAYYDFASGFYLGGGLGLAFPKATTDWDYFISNSASETKISLMGALMAGYEHYLSNSVVLDLRYRLAGFVGPKYERGTIPRFEDDPLESLEINVGFILDNSISVGLRYEF